MSGNLHAIVVFFNAAVFSESVEKYTFRLKV